MVTNGMYAAGGRAVGTNVLVNRVAVDKPIALRSVNGSQFTIIQGYQVPGTTNGDVAIRCVFLTSGASLSGFTLTKGGTRTFRGTNFDDREYTGGGLWCESAAAVISNCELRANAASSDGGAVYRGTLNACTLDGNWAGGWGGGACSNTLTNCVVTNNAATRGGGHVQSHWSIARWLAMWPGTRVVGRIAAR